MSHDRACQDLARRSYAGLWAHPVGFFILTVGSPFGATYPKAMSLATVAAVIQAAARWAAARRLLAEKPAISARAYDTIALVSLFSMAAVWGVLAVTGIWQFGPRHGATHLIFLMLAGISAGGIMAAAPRPPVLYCYTVVPWTMAFLADVTIPEPAWAECSVKVLYFAFLLIQGKRLSVTYEEAVQRELDLEQARLAAEASSAAKDRFLANMSHEIRTPMNGVLGTLALLEKTRLDREQRDLASLARDSAQGLLGMLNDILDLAKIEAGRMSIERISFDLASLCAGAIGMFRGSASAKGLSIKLLRSGPGEEQVTGDPTRLRQVLANLIGNAVKFTDTGFVQLEVERRGEAVRFTVADSGIGIAREKVNDIFHAFVQANSDTTRRHGGTGLGLAISQELVALIGGRLEVESEPGRGSRFSFEIPLPRVAPAAASVPAPAVESPDAPPAPAEEAPPLRVLLVEDGTVNQRVVLGMLRLLGHQAELAKNGAEALDAARRQPYDLILMDVQMPVMNGLEATQAIRELEAAAGRPRSAIHGLSANAYESDRERGLASGMDGYLTKPVGIDTLRALLGQVHEARTPVTCPATRS